MSITTLVPSTADGRCRIIRRVRRPRPADRDPVDLACAIHRKAEDAAAEGDLGRAEHWCRRALAILDRHLGSTHPDYANVANTLGEILESRSDYAAAEHVFRQSVAAMDAVDADLDAVHLIRIQSVMHLGNVLLRRPEPRRSRHRARPDARHRQTRPLAR